MTEQPSAANTYHANLPEAEYAFFGDYMTVTQNFYGTQPTAVLARDSLLDAIHRASADLLGYPNRVAGIHFDRPEVEGIIEWARNADGVQRFGVLVDQPGMGKTVVMRDVLEGLRAVGVPAIGIRTDGLSYVETPANLAEQLGLPASLEEVAQQLAPRGLFVVLLDQLDALSLSLARDQTTLDLILGTIANLRDIDGVRVIVSCRAFDLHNDARLSTLRPDREFALQPLQTTEVDAALRAMRVEPAQLLNSHRELLRVPLRLSIYGRIVSTGPAQYPPDPFRTLQDLYDGLWSLRIMAVPPLEPPVARRKEVVYRLVEAMHRESRLGAPLATLDDLAEATRYLQSVDFIQRKAGGWFFFHQTAFDYCYAQRFVADNRCLSAETLAGSQGLFERSQLVQVITHLRGVDRPAYVRELESLLLAEGLRVHLRLLLIGWFGNVRDPDDDEARIARRLLADEDDRVLFVRAIRGNEYWFDLLHYDLVPLLLAATDERQVDWGISYLCSLVGSRRDETLAHLVPYIGRGGNWHERIATCLSCLEDWRYDVAFEMLCGLLRQGRHGTWELECIHKLGVSNPALGCRALRILLDCLIAAPDHTDRPEDAACDEAGPIGLPDERAWQRLLAEYEIRSLTGSAVKRCPEALVEHILPWLVAAVTQFTGPLDATDVYPRDPVFAWNWHSRFSEGGPVLAAQMANALGRLAQTEPGRFRAIVSELAGHSLMAIHRIIAGAYLADPERYAADIAAYLAGDTRRLVLGDLGCHYHDSRRLFGVAMAHLDVQSREHLEHLILSYPQACDPDLRSAHEVVLLGFLKSVSPELLSPIAQARLSELERKYPGYQPERPAEDIGGAVGPPIDEETQANMSDEDWLREMRKYNEATEWYSPDHDPLKGGVVELASSFGEQVKRDPERFYKLACRFDDTIPLHYVAAAIAALAESQAPAEWLFDAVRHLGGRLAGSFRRRVCWALERRASSAVPEDILDLLADWALNDPEEGMTESGDPYSDGINSNRGAATQAFCRCALKREPALTERSFVLLEEVCEDRSSGVRACVVAALPLLLDADGVRAVAIFQRAVEGRPELLQSHVSDRFLYYTYYPHYDLVCRYIEEMLVSDQETTRQTGARLACLAALAHSEAHELMERALAGDPAMRRGAAQVYATNLGVRVVQDACREHLLGLMGDPDETVRAQVGGCFHNLDAGDLELLTPFIESFVGSPSLLDGAEGLLAYLKRAALDQYDLVLLAVSSILDAIAPEAAHMRLSRTHLDDHLVSLALMVYTHAPDVDTQSRAMALFERLLLQDSRAAHRALGDWDRR